MLWCLGEVDSAREGDDEVAGLRDAVGGVSRRGVGGGAWCAEKKPGRSGFGSTRGRGVVLAGGAARGRDRWRRWRTVPSWAGSREAGEGDGGSGSLVNNPKFKTQF